MLMSDEIYHYGIKGMRWGIRRFQYKDGRLTSAGKKRYGDKTDGDVSVDKPDTKGIHLTDKQKKALKIGLTVAGVALAAYGGYRLYNSDLAKPVRDQIDNYIKSMINQAKATEVKNASAKDRDIFAKTGKLTEHAKQDLSTREIDSRFGWFKKRFASTPEEDLKAINEGMFEKTPGGSNNCGLCTTAYELRRRGYDVRANFSDNGRSVIGLSNFFKDVKILDDAEIAKNVDSTREWTKGVTDLLRSQGEGARGNFCGQYFFGGGHSIIYEVVNGDVIFRDGQTGQNYKDAYDALHYFTPGRSNFFRMDNLEINKDTIQDAVSTFGKPRLNRRLMENDPTQANYIRKAIIELKKNYKTWYNRDITLAEARGIMKQQYGGML